MKVQWSMKVQRSMKMSRARTCERSKRTAGSLEEGCALHGLLLRGRALASAAYAVVPKSTGCARAGVPADRRPPFRGASGRVRPGVTLIDLTAIWLWIESAESAEHSPPGADGTFGMTRGGQRQARADKVR